MAEFQPLLKYVDPEIEWDVRAMEIPDLGVLYGHAGVISFWVRWLAEWTEYSWKAADFEAVGDHVLYDVTIRGTSRLAEVPVELTQTQVMSFRDGKIVRFRILRTRDDARAVVSGA